MDKRVSKEELEYVAGLFTEYMRENDGSSSEYEVRSSGKLDSSITQPFQKISGNDLYPTLVSRASMLYYLCIKNHPFEDGNKRMGIFVLLIYLAKNGYWLDCNEEELFDITVYTAGSDVKDMEEVRGRIERFVEENMVPSDLSTLDL
jgi:death-on-curing protein